MSPSAFRCIDGTDWLFDGPSRIHIGNRVNAVIFFFGKSGEFATNRRDQQELGMVVLHIRYLSVSASFLNGGPSWR